MLRKILQNEDMAEYFHMTNSETPGTKTARFHAPQLSPVGLYQKCCVWTTSQFIWIQKRMTAEAKILTPEKTNNE